MVLGKYRREEEISSDILPLRDRKWIDDNSSIEWFRYRFDNFTNLLYQRTNPKWVQIKQSSLCIVINLFFQKWYFFLRSHTDLVLRIYQTCRSITWLHAKMH